MTCNREVYFILANLLYTKNDCDAFYQVDRADGSAYALSLLL